MGLYAKLFKLQGQLEPIKKDLTNPHFKNRYASIDSVLDIVRPLLTKVGLLLLQPLNGRVVTTEIIDPEAPEEKISSSLELPEGLDPQKSGAGITYFRRYTLVALLGLEQEDVDGNSTARDTHQPPDIMTATPAQVAGGVTQAVGEIKCDSCPKMFSPKFAWAKSCITCFNAKKAKEADIPF